ncbi:ATP-dependent RNA helicase HrpA [Endozoicomonas sp. G2_1]|uniref:ATP-dependent RNA helicase HrpA n=1 Tax=Endozoicomonas sp. G2_1 TaxID=2821091 RepID=UPI001AD99D53|nr:ATP-dependent RNA helicase HrpA [Endozoicomonas sp. G2_1]MBO9491978.1 ATP-dependent RNA helicase HrpA [Endozoicomonas sp. G2_1]
MSNFSSLYNLLEQAKKPDIGRFKKRLQGIKKIQDADKQAKVLSQIKDNIEQSIAQKKLKQSQKPAIVYPQGLPVSQSVEQISQAICDNQVVIIAGETGSGKTTQIPKICLELGRGIDGLIGHTQPRRIAARTVATRIAEELNSQLGELVGYKVRFTDQVSDRTYIKLMTDGILLAEMQQDRLLRQYDTLIIDEAHERSLNIDFILGYIKQILPRRPDLKVIITSATIDPERFAKHFADVNNKPAPIIEVSGRTYPVEVLYRPLAEQDDPDVISGILQAVDELTHLPGAANGQGDILIFLNGEREIRDTAAALERENLRHTHILPLYARLTVQEQNRIFQPHSGRNIVLATNVAETSLTVPGIKYVIDPGTARISRYSYRTKVQRLPIEHVSQASANQRAGRCGRVSSGVCIRLYSEEDYLSRPEFTDPEILRTNLATVILQMLALDLGDISDFPFVQPPDKRNINDGIRLLEELDAMSSGSATNGKSKAKLSAKPKGGSQHQLTSTGRILAKFPIDPRLAKMILTAQKFGCIEPILAIVSALSIQDPRERPHEKQQAADEKHSRFKDKESDFLSLLNLWQYVKAQQKALSNNQFRRLCQKEYLSYIRIREWQDIFSQLKLTLHSLKIEISQIDLEDAGAASLIHQSILSGLLSHIGQLDENREYKGARNSRFFIFPGSGLVKKSPKWLMAAELVETSRLFARMAAKIDVSWLEPLAGHLIKASYSEPHWEKKQAAVMAYQQLSLYGLVIVAKRKVNFHAIEPDTCREIFIREALVNGDVKLHEPFFKANKALLASIDEMEQKARRRDFLVDEEQLYQFYAERIPQDVISLRGFLNWWKKQKAKTPELLNFTREFLLNEDTENLSANAYPDIWHQGNIQLPLSYHFNPGEIDDGISVHIPLALLNQVENSGFDWLIPALRHELIIAMIKGLPKTLRRNFVPAPNYADACVANIHPEQGTLFEAVAKQLLRMSGVRLPEDCWQTLELPPHLVMNFKVFDEHGKLLKQGRDFDQLKAELQGKVKASIKKVADKGIERKAIKTWDFADIPTGYEKKVANITMRAFPALVDKKSSVAIELFEQQALADQAMLDGVTRLILLNVPSPLKYLQEKLPNKAKLGLYFNPFGSIAELLDDCIYAAARALVEKRSVIPRTESEFDACKDEVRAEIADLVLAGALKLEQALSLAHDIRKKLKGSLGFAMIQSQGDIKQQLDNMVYKGFVTASGFDRLSDIIRYLNAILRRLEKLPIDPTQDRLKMLEVEKMQQRYQELLQQQPKSQPIAAELLETRWMIEEFRVSLFAQNLKTAYPISAKRIANHLKSFS